MLENMGQKGPKSLSAIKAEVKYVRQEIFMITTNEYLREKKRAEVAEARILELEAELAQYKNTTTQVEGEVFDALHSEPESEDAPE
jgi:hypothetical protein